MFEAIGNMEFEIYFFFFIKPDKFIFVTYAFLKRKTHSAVVKKLNCQSAPFFIFEIQILNLIKITLKPAPSMILVTSFSVSPALI